MDKYSPAALRAEKAPPADGIARSVHISISTAAPPAAPATASSSKGDSYKCKICPQQFDTLQECLKHELLTHGLQKQQKQQKRPQKTLRNKLNTIVRMFSDNSMQTLRTQIHSALGNCAPGEELPALFKFHRMNVENLELIYARIHACLEKELNSLGGKGALKIFPFGSIASGLALRDSDIDLYIEINGPHNSNTNNYQSRQAIRSTYNKVNNLLHRSACFDEVFAIRGARVPIIKCKHSPTGFSLDINLSCPSSVHNTNFLRDLVAIDVRLHELLLFLKLWARQLQLIGRGNMSSYCLITLVIFYLQQPNQPWASSYPLVPSIEELQAHEPPNVVLGVNYAYNLSTRQLPPALSVLTIVRGFFAFYRQFDFEHSLVAPYLGVALPLEDFKAGTCDFPAYENQMRALAILHGGEPVDGLQVDRCMCVQDPFALNLNVAKSMSPPNLDYMRKCLHHAHRICTEEAHSDAQLYEALLYGIVERIAHAAELEQQAVGQSTTTCNNGVRGPSELTYSFTPCRAEMRALAAYTPVTELAGAGGGGDDDRPLHRLWVRRYSDAIAEIITEVYRLDMQSATPTHSDKQQRLDNADRTRTWLLSGSVDMWTGRLHQRSATQTFMAYQRAQSETMARERRQKAAYAVQLSGVLSLSIVGEFGGIELRVTQRESENLLCKKDPLRKFFTTFKCSMQNFNLKERLQEELVSSKAAEKPVSP